MNIVIVGCGKIGTTILASLVSEGHDVVAVDISADAISEIRDVYDAMCVCGNGTDYETLEEAGVKKADIFIAATHSDEFNCMSCFLAKRMGAAYTIARIRNPEYSDRSLAFVKQQMDISLSINPELLAAHEIFNILKLPSAVNIDTFSRRGFEMVEIRLKSDSALDGMKIMDIRKKYSGNYLICAVQRGEEAFIPDGNFVIKAGDRIGLTAPSTEVPKLLKKLGIMQKQARNVMILGASRIANYLSKMLIKSGNSIKVIDINQEKCIDFSETYPSAVVIKGDGANHELLSEEGISDMDAFVSLTGMDEQNILVSFFASSQKVPKVISKVNSNELASMAERLGLECVISPSNIIADVIRRYARALQNTMGSNVETLYRIMDNKAEALEFNVQSDFKYIDVPLKDLSLKPNILIAGILRGRTALVPSGTDVISKGDKVIVLATGHNLNDLSDIIRGV